MIACGSLSTTISGPASNAKFTWSGCGASAQKSTLFSIKNHPDSNLMFTIILYKKSKILYYPPKNVGLINFKISHEHHSNINEIITFINNFFH
jgi:hypothetical protein